jgi:putative endopeptidase
MRIAMVKVLLVCFTGLAFAQSPAANRGPSDADAPIPSLPYTPGLNVEFLDTSADPCVDFYQYSCGGWMKKNPELQGSYRDSILNTASKMFDD